VNSRRTSRIKPPLLIVGVLASAIPALAASFQENFDGVAPPALPAGWTATAASNGVVWQTNGFVSDTAPNSVGVAVPAAVADQSLYSPPIVLSNTSGTITLTFRHKFAFDKSNNGANDGGRLEISISGVRQGAFQDIIDAGGTFVTGGYTDPISSTTNPLYGEAAMLWSGFLYDSFMTTTVELPASAAGSTIQLRWRMVSDDSVSTLGWKVDSIKLCDPGDTTSNICPSDCNGGACGTSGMSAMAVSLAGLISARRVRRRRSVR